MKRLRFWTAILSIWLIFFFNIERILFEADLNLIQSYTYVFVAIIGVAILALPKLPGLSFSALLIICVAVFLFFWYNNSIWRKNLTLSGAYVSIITLLTIIQVTAIILTGLIARQINFSLNEFENVIAGITFSHIGQLPKPFSKEQGIMYNELKRARRYERPLTVIALKVDQDDIQVALPKMVWEVQQAMMKQYVLAGITRVLDDNLYEFDTIALRDNYFVIVLPEVQPEKTPSVARRLEETVKEKMGMKLQIGVANFTDKAETFEGLIDLAMIDANKNIEVQLDQKQPQPQPELKQSQPQPPVT